MTAERWRGRFAIDERVASAQLDLRAQFQAAGQIVTGHLDQAPGGILGPARLRRGTPPSARDAPEAAFGARMLRGHDHPTCMREAMSRPDDRGCCGGEMDAAGGDVALCTQLRPADAGPEPGSSPGSWRSLAGRAFGGGWAALGSTISEPTRVKRFAADPIAHARETPRSTGSTPRRRTRIPVFGRTSTMPLVDQHLMASRAHCAMPRRRLRLGRQAAFPYRR